MAVPAFARPASGWPFAAAIEPLAIKLGDPQKAREEKLTAWLDALVLWNARIDLTAARDAGELCDLMIADAAQVAALIPEGARVVDVGSGAGAPGLALAILRPDLRVTLVEPLAKRTSFMRTVIAAIGRTDIDVRSVRVEALAKDSWDVAMARATFSPPEWLVRGAELAKTVIVFLAKEPAPSLPTMRGHDPIEYAWPNTNAARSIVRYTRI